MYRNILILCGMYVSYEKPGPVVRVSKVPTSASPVDGPTGIKILQAAEIRGYDLLSTSHWSSHGLSRE